MAIVWYKLTREYIMAIDTSMLEREAYDVRDAWQIARDLMEDSIEDGTLKPEHQAFGASRIEQSKIAPKSHDD